MYAFVLTILFVSTKVCLAERLGDPQKQVPVDRPQPAVISVPSQNWAGSVGTQKKTTGIYGKDDRTLSKSREYPYRTIGVMTGSGKPHCTCTLVGECWVLTAGHCVAHDDGTIVKDLGCMTIDPDEKQLGLDNKAMGPSGIIFGSSGTPYRDDWALVKLRNPIGKKLGWMGMKNVSGKELEKKTFTVIGYPSDFDKKMQQAAKDNKVRIVWAASSIRAEWTPNYIYHNGHTFGGVSGSAIWEEKGPTPMIVGIVTRGLVSSDGTNPKRHPDTTNPDDLSGGVATNQFFDKMMAFMKTQTCDGPPPKVHEHNPGS